MREASRSHLQEEIMKPQQQFEKLNSYDFLIPVFKFAAIVLVALVVIFQVAKLAPNLRNLKGGLVAGAAADLAKRCRSSCGREQWKMCDWMHVVCSRQKKVQIANEPAYSGDQCKALMDQVTMAISMMKGYCPINDDSGDTSEDLLKTARENVKLPQRLDAQTTLHRFDAPDGRTLESIYIVDIEKGKEHPELKDALKRASITSNCQNRETRAGLKYGFAKLQTYLYRDGVSLFTQFTIEESDC